MKLIYINKIGQDWKGNFIYEFLFSDTNLDDIDGENWDEFPASGQPEPPNPEFINDVAHLKSNLKLDLTQESESFCMWDAIDGLVPLGWENITDYDEYPEKRLFFSFGEEKKIIEDKLYEKDIVLSYENEFNI